MQAYKITTETLGPISFKDEFVLTAADRDHLKEQILNLCLHPDTKVTITEIDS